MSDIQYGSRIMLAPDKVYLIGDVHNEADKLQNLLDKIEPILGINDHIVFCGDLFDRGGQSAETLITLIDLAKRYPDQVFFIHGNHDWMLQHYLTTGKHDWLGWLKITLEGWQELWKLPNIKPLTISKALSDNGFLEISTRIAPYYETKDIIATHAPIDKVVVAMRGGDTYQLAYANRMNDPNFEYLLDRMEYEIKWSFTNEKYTIPCIDKFRVCGHQYSSGTTPRIFADRAFIDTGCGLKKPNPITCLIFPGKKYLQGK